MHRWPVLALALWGITACSIPKQARRIMPADSVAAAPSSAFRTKAHARDGDVLIFEKWSYDSTTRVLAGTGRRLDPNRQEKQSGELTIPLDSVVIIESNTTPNSDAVAGLTMMSAASGLITVGCIANPKACFGSCPTFYVSDGDRDRLQAEGFSASIAPSMEASDIDALARARIFGRRVTVRMTNEALETHVVRHVTLLAVPRPAGTRVIADDIGTLRIARSLIAPTRCSAAEGDCSTALADFDDRERFSKADRGDLASRETIELEFPAAEPGTPLGIAIASRQTLMSTYLFYQMLAYLGDDAGAFLAALERGDSRADRGAKALGKVLGGIEVQIRDANGDWRTVGETEETGPIATDLRLVPLPVVSDGRPIAVRLRLTRGHWRLDQVALAVLGDAVKPLSIEPTAVLRGQVVDPVALQKLRPMGDALVTGPGDEYTLQFDLPEDAANYELLLESRGYYIEWMRDAWRREQSRMRVRSAVLNPAGFLRSVAPAYAKWEPQMDSLFWASRYVPR